MTTPANDPSKMTETVMTACTEANQWASSYVNAATKSGAVALKGMEEMTRDMSGLMQETYARAISACKAIMSAKSPQEAAETHSEFLKDCFDGMVSGSGKLSQASMRLAKEAIEPLSQHANDAMGAVMKRVKTG